MGKYKPQNAGTVANVAPSPLKQPRNPSDAYISRIELIIFGLVEPFCNPPDTCIRVRKRSRGAHTIDAREPDPTPAINEEVKFCLSASSASEETLFEAVADDCAFIFRDPDHEWRFIRGIFSDGVDCCSGFIRVGCVGLLIAAELPKKIVKVQKISFKTLNGSISAPGKLNRYDIFRGASDRLIAVHNIKLRYHRSADLHNDGLVNDTTNHQALIS